MFTKLKALLLFSKTRCGRMLPQSAGSSLSDECPASSTTSTTVNATVPRQRSKNIKKVRDQKDSKSQFQETVGPRHRYLGSLETPSALTVAWKYNRTSEMVATHGILRFHTISTGQDGEWVLK